MYKILTKLIEDVKEIDSRGITITNKGFITMIENLLEDIKKRKYHTVLKTNDTTIFTIEEWEDCDMEDGYGYWVKNGYRSDHEVFNTDQLDATHVVWYNK